MLLLPLFEVLNRAEITQTSLGSLAIVEHFNVLKDPLSGFIACRIQVPVDDFLFQYGEKTLAPGIISWFANPGKALLSPVPSDLIHHRLSGVLAASVTMPNNTGR